MIRPPTSLIGLSAVSAISALCCWISISFTRAPGGLSSLWLASGVLTGTLLTSPRPTWRAIVVAAVMGNVLVRVTQGDVWYSVLGLGFASTLEAILVALVLEHHVADVTDPATVKRLSIFAISATLAACALSATIAAAVQAGSGADPFRAFQTWLASHTLGMVIFVTLTLMARAQGSGLWGRPGRRVGLALSVILVGLTSLAVFSQPRYPLLFLIFPPVMLVVFRYRFSGVVWGISTMTVIAIPASLSGRGPIQLIPGAGDLERILVLQIFIATACLSMWSLAVIMTERAFFRRRLLESERLYRLLADNSRDMVVRLRLDGQQLYVSPSAKELLGWEVDELSPAPRWDLIHPHDRALLSRSITELAAQGGEATISYRVRHKDGRYVWIEALSRLMPSGDSGGPEIISTNRDVTRRVEAEEALAALARYDTLTGLANRFHFDERAEVALARHRRTSRAVALLYLDIDRFKEINDTMGHAAGDAVLREMARRLKEVLRVTDFPARIGGDEFLVLIEDVDSRDTLGNVVRKILAALQSAFVIDGMELSVTASIGIALCNAPLSNSDEMRHLADTALYQAKAAGRNTYHVTET